jgi:succinate dehydrogenase / fumarate reductase flavoprotein subunit
MPRIEQDVHRPDERRDERAGDVRSTVGAGNPSGSVRFMHDVVVVGAGCAGMRAAIEAFDTGASVGVVSKLHPTRSHSGAAEGGINAALGNTAEDSPEKHAFDTVKGSDYLGDQDAIEILAAEAPGDIYQLEHWGCVFSRNDEGKLAQRPFGAAGSPRTVYSADITGHVLIHVLYEQLMKRQAQGPMHVYEEYFAWRLVMDGDRCVGVVCWDLVHGGLKLVTSRSIVLATGGMGRIYRATTNAYACNGDGMAMALHAGLPLKDMEFMQFHPTTLYPSGVLITEGCRGEGGFLINRDGERFMARYAPNALELASRDVVSRSETTEIEAGRGVSGSVLLDLRHLGAERITTRLPGSRELAMTFAGVDPIYDPIPVRPGAHYHMGGVATDNWGKTEVDGLYAAGEVACVSVHGANRLGGNSLMETITFGRRAGQAAAEAALVSRNGGPVSDAPLVDAERDLKTLLDRSEGERPWRIRDELGASMLENFGVFRYPDRMERQLDTIQGLRERYEHVVVDDKGDVFNTDLTQALELGSMLDLAWVMVQAGLAREESRGAHSRPSDFPERDDERFLHHSLTRWEDDAPVLSREEVRMTKWQPEVRSY